MLILRGRIDNIKANWGQQTGMLICISILVHLFAKLTNVKVNTGQVTLQQQDIMQYLITVARL